MRNNRLMLAFVVSAVLALVVGILSNIAATYWAPSLADKPWLVYGALGVTFFISLLVSLYLFRRGLPESQTPAATADSSSATPQPQLENAAPSPSALPIRSYRELVGRDALVGEVMAALRDPGGKWIVALDGMGGIGKTALAREIAGRVQAERLFDGVVWEQAAKEPLAPGDPGRAISTLTFETALDSIARQLGAPDVPRLKGLEKEERVRALLQAQRVLVVLDNLETASEPQSEIVRRLRPLLDPSKALLTSRHRFQGDLYAIHLSGLTEDDALRFIRQEVEEKHLSRVAPAKVKELKRVIQTTGGSPLALKLVVGQLEHSALDTVLNQLSNVRLPQGDSDEDDYIRFYKDIFFLSWRLLSRQGKDLLIAMAHFAPNVGGTLEAIRDSSGLADETLIRSINELWRLSFLEVGEPSSLNKVRYSLHALTQHFVKSDIVRVL